MSFLESLGQEFCEIRRKEDVYALWRSLDCLDTIVEAGLTGYAARDQEHPHVGYLLQLGLVRQDDPLPADVSTLRYYATLKGVQMSQQLAERIRKRTGVR